MKKRMAGLIALLLLATAGTAIGGERAGAVTFSPYIGGYTFDGVQRLDTNLLYGGRLGYNITKNWAVEGSGDYVRTNNTTGPSKGINAIKYRLEGLYNFNPDGKLVPFLALGGGGSTITVPGKTNTDAIASLGAGIKYFVTEDIALRGDVRNVWSFHDNNYISPYLNPGGSYWVNYEYNIGLQFLFGGKKPVVAKIVEPPPPPPPPVVVVVPPPSPVDGMVGAWSDWSACSAPCGSGTQTRTRPVVTQPANGGAALPTLSESRSCNTQACMEEEKVNLLIQFDFDKAVIKKEFYPNVDAIGAFLKKNNKISITLDGWTDSIGTVKYNLKLSQRRADAVKKYLVDNFKIDPARINAVGHGISKLHDNKTEVGRYKNRRVEMNYTLMVEKK
jgi:OOP family OmpA-OmpF porin